MTNTAHERAMILARSAYIVRYMGEPTGDKLDDACKAYLQALLDDAETAEAISRGICAADKLAPDPDANVLYGMKTMKAWEARIPLAQGAIATLKRMGGV